VGEASGCAVPAPQSSPAATSRLAIPQVRCLWQYLRVIGEIVAERAALSHPRRRGLILEVPSGKAISVSVGHRWVRVEGCRHHNPHVSGSNVSSVKKRLQCRSGILAAFRQDTHANMSAEKAARMPLLHWNFADGRPFMCGFWRQLALDRAEGYS
jgi:hypothetical protein